MAVCFILTGGCCRDIFKCLRVGSEVNFKNSSKSPPVQFALSSDAQVDLLEHPRVYIDIFQPGLSVDCQCHCLVNDPSSPSRHLINRQSHSQLSNSKRTRERSCNEPITVFWPLPRRLCRIIHQHRVRLPVTIRMFSFSTECFSCATSSADASSIPSTWYNKWFAVFSSQHQLNVCVENGVDTSDTDRPVLSLLSVSMESLRPMSSQCVGLMNVYMDTTLRRSRLRCCSTSMKFSRASKDVQWRFYTAVMLLNVLMYWRCSSRGIRRWSFACK